MEMRPLRYFVAVADAGSFSRAAAVLDMAQPSLSRQIAALESELGQRLLVRHGRGVALTEAGEVLLGHARAMLECAERAREALRDLQDSPSGRVTVGLPPRVALGLSAPLVQRFRARFPRAVITVLEGLSVALRESLIAGRLDMALLFDPSPSPMLRLESLMRERLVLVAPAGTALPPRVAAAALASYALVLPSAPNAIRALLDRHLALQGIHLEVGAEVGAVGTALTLVAQGAGCSILPESALAADPRAASLPRALIGPPSIRNQLVLAVPVPRPASRLSRETAQILRELDFRSAWAGG